MRAWDATETAARIAAGEVSAEEVVRAAIERAGAWEPRINGVVTPTYEAAIERAQGPVSGTFAGVPSFIKDLDHIAGVPTGMGSRAFDGFVPKKTSPCVQQFLDTGFISLGKSSTPEFGLTATTEPKGVDPTRNPWNTEHSSGGSSGGAAALVASGVVPLAYASDGGGSIRIPASFCGLVGLKPSRGRLTDLDRAADMPVKIATYGVVSRSVRDTAAYYAAVEKAGSGAGLEPVGDVKGPGKQKLKIGFYPESPLKNPVDPAVKAMVEETAKLLEGMGHTVVEHNPFTPELVATFSRDFFNYWGLLGAGVPMMCRRTLGDRFKKEQLNDWTRGLAGHFRRNIYRVPTALWRLRRFEKVYTEAYGDFDVMIGPTTAGPAPKLQYISPNQPFQLKFDRLHALVPFTPIQNVSGTPAISLPMSRSASGLPLGVHISTTMGRERTLLELAYALEEAKPWTSLVEEQS